MKSSEPEKIDEILEIKIRAGIPIIQLVSYEWRRIFGFCIQVAEKTSKNLYLWSNDQGIAKWDLDESKEITVNDETREPEEAIRWFLNEAPPNSLFLMADLHLYFDSPQFRQIAGLLRGFTKSTTNENGKTIILSQPTPSLLPVLQKDVYVIEIPLPPKKVLLSVLDEAISELGILPENAKEKDRDRFADAARGLTSTEAKYVFREIGLKFKAITEDKVPLIIREKEQIIKKSGILEYFHPSEDLKDVGGMDQLKEWLKRRKAGFEPDAEGFGMTPPKGVLLLGVQGCGKSLIAKAISSEWQLPLLKFDLGRVYGGIVGESENNIRRALETSRAIAPSILWIDEIEKGLSGIGSSNETDGGTTSRVFGTMLTWMQEKKEPVFVIATANDISKLPPELLRKGRFDEIFFVDLPGLESRKDIWKIHLMKRLGKDRFETNKYDIDQLSKISEGYSGAEIEEAINEGLYLARFEERDLTMKDLESSIKGTVPLSRVMGENIGKLRKWAKVRAKLASSEEGEEIKPSGEKIPQLRQEKASPLFE